MTITRASTVQYLVSLARRDHGERGAMLVLLLATEPQAVGYGDLTLGEDVVADLERCIDDWDLTAERVVREMADALEEATERDAQGGLGWS